jgi:hypothetical protein
MIINSMKQTPQVSLTIKAPLDKVWTALRHKEKLLQWHGWETPTLKDEIENIYFTDTKEGNPTDSSQRQLTVNGGDSFILEAHDKHTILTLVRAPLSGNREWDTYYDNITEGWVSFLEQLRFMLEHQPDRPRHTTIESSKIKHKTFIKEVGIGNEQEGATFTGTFDNEEISGMIYFITSKQIGLLVNEWGPGLLIVQFSEAAYIRTRYTKS